MGTDIKGSFKALVSVRMERHNLFLFTAIMALIAVSIAQPIDLVEANTNDAGWNNEDQSVMYATETKAKVDTAYGKCININGTIYNFCLKKCIGYDPSIRFYSETTVQHCT